MSQIQFDATKVAPKSDRTAIPEGEYHVVLSASEITKTTNGQMIKSTLRVLDGEYAGQSISFNINHVNSNADCQRIGQETLSSVCHAVGVLQINDTAQLHGRPFRVKVSVREVVKEKDGVKTTNRYNDVDAVLMVDGSPVVAGKTAAPAAAAPPAFVTQAQAAAPAAAPAPMPAPAPAPTPTPAPAPADTRLFHVGHKGVDLTKGVPVNAAGVLAFGHPLAELHVCVNGEQTWQSGTILAPAAPAAAPTAPPWMK